MNRKQKIPYLRIITLVWLLHILVQNSVSLANQNYDKFKKGVVRIIGRGEDDSIYTGTGIITSNEKKEIYIITAHHVIQKFKQIAVEFYQEPPLLLKGKLYHKFNFEKDLAVIICKDEENKVKYKPVFRKGKVSNVKETNRIFTIGHASTSPEWTIRPGNIVTSDDISLLRLTGNAVYSGNSGGALLNEKGQLLGMVTKKGATDAIALKLDEIIECLKIWRIPIKFANKTWLWIAVGSTATIVTIIAFKWDDWFIPRPLPLPSPPDPPSF